MTTPPTLAEATAFILTDATEDDLRRLFDAIKKRRSILRQITAAAVQAGTDVELTGLSPQYLNGLRGTVESIQGAHATILLDRESTTQLRYSGSRRFHVPDDEERHPLRGVPLGSCTTL